MDVLYKDSFPLSLSTLLSRFPVYNISLQSRRNRQETNKQALNRQNQRLLKKISELSKKERRNYREQRRKGKAVLRIRNGCTAFCRRPRKPYPSVGLFLGAAKTKAVSVRHIKAERIRKQHIHRRRSRSICRNSGRAGSLCLVRQDMKN